MPPISTAHDSCFFEEILVINIFNTSFELSESDVDTAVLPMGSVEPKGPHLPVGFDLMLANRFARDLCTGRSVYLLPVFPFSTAMETRGFPGALALEQQSLCDILGDIASVLARHRFRRLVILDFSRYNWILKQAVREINLNRELIQAIWVNPREFAQEAADPDLMPDYGGGAVDTSLALFLDRQWVHSLPTDFNPDLPREYIDYQGLERVAPRGFWGKPSRGTKELGKSFYDLMLEKTRDFIDYALKLFPGGTPLGDHKKEEIWWPDEEIPGIEGDGFDWKNTFSEIVEGAPELAVIPTSSTEQHSPSQPLATDFLQALELARRVAGKLSAYLLPALPVVTSWGHIRFRGTVTLTAMTVRRILEDLVASLYAGGIRKAVLINVHGGNWVLKPTMIEINRKYKDFTLISVGDILAYRGQATVEHLHADEEEASFIKAFYPKCFKQDQIVDYSPKCTAAAFDLVGIDGVSPQGVWGYPSRATEEKGFSDLDRKVRKAVSYINRFMDSLD